MTLTRDEKMACIDKVRRYEIEAARLRIHEVANSNTGPDVQTAVGVQGVNHWLADVGFPGGGEPWCAAFQFSAIDDSKIDLGYRTASCPQIEEWARKCGILYTHPRDARDGDLALYQEWDTKGVYSGHVAFVDRVNGDGTFESIEGNTSDENGVNADGGGVFRKTRRCIDWYFVRWVDMVRTAPATLHVHVAGNDVDCSPRLEANRVRVDVRPLAVALGARIDLAAGAYRVMAASGKAIDLTLGEQNSGRPTVENGRLRADLRPVVEGLGLQVDVSRFGDGIISVG